jgi:tRNA A37 threonylcarbamoyladenosine synthetase subunit TsaC/SUA5/YrdC
VAVHDRDRTILWSRSGSRCAICRRELVQSAEHRSGVSVVGREIKIASLPAIDLGDDRSLRAGSDEHENLILLCVEHQKAISDQPGEYPPEELRAIKAHHERWVSKNPSWSKASPGDPHLQRGKSPNRILVRNAELALPSLAGPILYRSDEWQAHRSMADILGVMRHSGGIIVSPSDGGYGVNVDPSDEDRVALIRRLLNKPGNSLLPDSRDPIPVVFDSVKRVRAWTDMSEQHARVFAELWPGPLTLLAEPGRPRARRAASILSDGLTFGVRQTSSTVERALVSEAGVGLASMAIRDGSGSIARRADDAIDILTAAMAREGIFVPFVVIEDDRFLYSGQSTVVELTQARREVNLIREGCVSYAKLRTSLMRLRQSE